MNKRFLFSFILICLLMLTFSVSFARSLSTRTRDDVTYYGVECGCTLVFPSKYTIENSSETPNATQISGNVARVKGVGPFRINVIDTQNNKKATIDFFSWNVLLKHQSTYCNEKSCYYSYSFKTYSSPGGSNVGSIKSRAWIAGELTSDGKYFKILDCFVDPSGYTSSKDSSGKVTPVKFSQNASTFKDLYITSYYDASSDNSTSGAYTYYMTDNSISFDIEEAKLTNWSSYTPQPTQPAGDAPQGHTIVAGYTSSDHIRGPLCEELTNNYTHFYYCEVVDCDYKYEENHTYGSDNVCTVCGKTNPSPTQQPTQQPTTPPTQQPTQPPTQQPTPTPGSDFPAGHDKVGSPSDHSKSTQFVSSGNNTYHYYACTAKDKGCTYKYEEKHSVPTKWEPSEEAHYKICTNPNCNTIVANEKHKFDSNNKCTVCEYTKGSVITPSPTPSRTPTPTTSPTPTDHAHNYGADFRCTICGKLHPSHTGEGEHKASASWSSTDTEHIKKCANMNCSCIIDKGPHTFVNGKCSVCGWLSTGTNPSPTPGGEASNGDLVVESYMKTTKELSSFAISLRSESPAYTKSNKNIYGLGESIKYSIDYRNGGPTTYKAMNITLTLPLSFEVVGYTDAKVDTTKNTITWTLASGVTNGEGGTKTVTIKYKALKSSAMAVQTIYPVATLQPENNYSASDTSAVINVIFKDENTVITEKHEPYMIGDANGQTFRPNDGISRAEGALVLARVFGINYAGTAVQGNEFTDINETYAEAQKAIVACTKLGLITGMGDGTYRPNDKMTNAQFMKIIACFVELKAQEDNIQGIEIKNASKLVKEYKNPTAVYMVGSEKVERHWAIEYLTLLIRLNMTPVSDENKDLKLDVTMTRAEVARLINLYLIRAPQAKGSSSFSDVSSNHELLGDILEASLPTHAYTLTRYGTEIAQ